MIQSSAQTESASLKSRNKRLFQHNRPEPDLCAAAKRRIVHPDGHQPSVSSVIVQRSGPSVLYKTIIVRRAWSSAADTRRRLWAKLGHRDASCRAGLCRDRSFQKKRADL